MTEMSSVHDIVKDFGADPQGVTDSTTAIQNAVNAASNAKGGTVYVPVGTFLVSSPIVIEENNVGFVGTGYGSILKANASLEFVMKITGNSAFGNRGAPVKDFFLNCQRKATNGLLVGSTSNGTVVNRYFRNINVSYALNWGLVIDAAQNNLFTLLDLEYNGGQLKMINGAGNNVFLRCEFNQSTILPHALFGADANYPGYNRNDFGNAPQNNQFIGCIFERGGGPYSNNVKLELGRNIFFESCDFATQNSTNAGVEISAQASFTYFNVCRFSGLTTNPNVAINNNGYRTYVHQCTFENYRDADILTSNYIHINHNTSNKTSGVPLIRNTGGNIAANIKDASAPYYIDGTDPATLSFYPSQFVYNDDSLWFQSKANLYKIFFNDSTSGSAVTTGTNHTVTFRLPSSGSWLVDIYSANGDYNHGRAATFIARFRDNSVHDMQTMHKMTPADATSGQLVTALNATVNAQGTVTVAITTSNSQTVNTIYRGIKLNSF